MEKHFHLVFSIELKQYHLWYKKEENHTLIHTPNFNIIWSFSSKYLELLISWAFFSYSLFMYSLVMVWRYFYGIVRVERWIKNSSFYRCIMVLPINEPLINCKFQNESKYLVKENLTFKKRKLKVVIKTFFSSNILSIGL